MSQANLSVFNAPEVVSYYAAMSYISPCEKLLFDRYIPPGLDVLDLGVGGGRTTGYLAPQASRYVGVDYAEEMVRACQAKFPQFDFRQADVTDLACFSAASFDVTLMAFNGIDSLPKDGRNRCFAECFRVLRPGGNLIFSAHNMRAVLVAPSWNRQRVRQTAQKASFGLRPLESILTAMLTVVVAGRAVVLAGLESLRRCLRLTRPAFWKGEGHMMDPAHRGILQHYSIPKHVMTEVEGHGFRFCEMEGSGYPDIKADLCTEWYYYAFQKPRP